MGDVVGCHKSRVRLYAFQRIPKYMLSLESASCISCHLTSPPIIVSLIFAGGVDLFIFLLCLLGAAAPYERHRCPEGDDKCSTPYNFPLCCVVSCRHPPVTLLWSFLFGNQLLFCPTAVTSLDALVGTKTTTYTPHPSYRCCSVSCICPWPHRYWARVLSVNRLVLFGSI